MKTKLLAASLLFSCLLVSTSGFAQVSIAATSLTDPGMRVFYVGVTNPFTVAVNGVAPEKLTVRSSSGTLTGSAGKYNIIVNLDQPHVYHTIITVSYLNSHRETVFADSVSFAIKRIPDPVTTLGGKKTGKISVDEMLAADSLVVIMEKCFLNLKFTVISFTFTFLDRGFMVEYAQPDGNRFTEEQKTAIRNLSSGQKIIFENIRCQGPDGTIRMLSPLIFLVE